MKGQQFYSFHQQHDLPVCTNCEAENNPPKKSSSGFTRERSMADVSPPAPRQSKEQLKSLSPEKVHLTLNY